MSYPAPKFIPVKVGDTYGKWSIVDPNPIILTQGGKCCTQYLSRCGCGVQRPVAISSLRRGISKSCGCVGDQKTKVRSTTHGLSSSKIYAIWNVMQQRIRVPTSKSFPDYGGRGLDMDPRWHTFETFYADMGDVPFKGASLERLDNNRGYWPDNVVWASRLEQNRNQRKTVRYSHAGYTLLITEWAEVTGIKHQTIASRLLIYGWTIEQALTRPVREHGHGRIIFTPKAIPTDAGMVEALLQDERDRYKERLAA